MIGIVFSDLHIGNFSKFNSGMRRTSKHLEVLFHVKEACNKYNCPAIFLGDLFHKPESIDPQLLDMVIGTFKELDDGSWKLYTITGNHDTPNTISIKKSRESNYFSWNNSFSKAFEFLESLDFKQIKLGKVKLYGVPYLDHNIGLSEYLKSLELDSKYKNILLLHSDYPGAKDNDGVEVGSVENLNLNMISKFDLTLMGHIHKPQKLGKKVYMVGAPLQQRRTDRDSELGYWLLHDDLKMEFKSLDMPKFIDVESEEDIKDDGNYYTVIKSMDVEVVSEEKKVISLDLTKRKLVRNYLKTKGIVDKDKKKLLLNTLKEAEND